MHDCYFWTLATITYNSTFHFWFLNQRYYAISLQNEFVLWHRPVSSACVYDSKYAGGAPNVYRITRSPKLKMYWQNISKSIVRTVFLLIIRVRQITIGTVTSWIRFFFFLFKFKIITITLNAFVMITTRTQYWRQSGAFETFSEVN